MIGVLIDKGSWFVRYTDLKQNIVDIPLYHEQAIVIGKSKENTFVSFERIWIKNQLWVALIKFIDEEKINI